MTHADAIDKISLRLNKLYSMDYLNIDTWKVTEAINKAVNNVIRRGLKGNNRRLEGDEETSFASDDFAVLLTEQTLVPINKQLYIEVDIPKDYRYFKRLTPLVEKGSCKGIQIISNFIEEANVNNHLSDYSSSPSFDFEETFHTQVGKKFRVYHNKDFIINSVNLVYYRNPIYLDIENQPSNTLWEFKDDLAEIMIDEAVMIIGGDTENVLASQNAEKNIDKNN